MRLLTIRRTSEIALSMNDRVYGAWKRLVFDKTNEIEVFVLMGLRLAVNAILEYVEYVDLKFSKFSNISISVRYLTIIFSRL